MTYLGELRDNVRPLAAASLGCGTSLPLFAYTSRVFAPHLIREFGWSRAQFALIGLTMLTTVFILPFVGRFTDRLGVWRVALLGSVLVPLCFVAYALQWGNFYYFMLCSEAVMAVGSMTGPLVYSRLIAENFVRAQGRSAGSCSCCCQRAARRLANSRQASALARQGREKSPGTRLRMRGRAA